MGKKKDRNLPAAEQGGSQQPPQPPQQQGRGRGEGAPRGGGRGSGGQGPRGPPTHDQGPRDGTRGAPSYHQGPRDGGRGAPSYDQGPRDGTRAQYDQGSRGGFSGGPRAPRPRYEGPPRQRAPMPFAPRSPAPQQSAPAAPWGQPVQHQAPPAPAWSKKSSSESSKPASEISSSSRESTPVPKDPPLPTPQPAPEPKAAGGKKGKGKKGGAGDKPQEPTKSQQPAELPPPVKDVTQQLQRATMSSPSLIIPRRRSGQEIKHTPQFVEKSFSLEVNYLPINFKDMKLKIFHYDVSFTPDGPKALLRPALNELLHKYVRHRHPAFDGRKNLYAGGSPLEFPKGQTLRDTVKVFDKERLSDKEFDITVKLVNQDLNLSKLANYMRSGTSLDMPQDVIQSTDIALRHAPIENFIQVGRSFFSLPTGPCVDLGGGFDLWHGYYQSAIMAWKPYLNVDVANKAFPKAQTLINYLQSENIDVNRPMENRDAMRLRRFIKGLKVEYRMPSKEPTGHTKRTYKIDDVCRSPRDERFKPDKNGSREMTIEEYFLKDKGVRLRYPHLPTLKTSNGNKLPIEFCDVAPNQAVMRKLDEKQTANMVRNAARPTDERRQRIFHTIQQSGFREDPCLQEFGISVDMRFEKVDAVILRPPSIQYQKTTVPVRNGTWRVNNDNFIYSPGLNDWIILNTDRKINDGHIKNLVQKFQMVGSRIGINVNQPKMVSSISVRSEDDFAREFSRLSREKNPVQIFLVIMTPFGIDDIYSKIKRAAELQTGILTQCLKSNTADFRKMNDMTAHNILLKINSKISGVNHALMDRIKPNILRRPIMIVGADVTHPAPGSDGISIAAVAASHDKYGFQYNMLYRLQPARREMIDDLESMIAEQLRFFRSKLNCKPERILYYRDGVSEGQFQQILDIELRSIRAACQKVEQGYKPGITFLVVQKRHHTRFFPSPADWDGPKNKNVVAGTLVDTKITHPTELDFYLVSHQSIQGTARPTKYHLLWDDNEIGQEELEQLTYYLCHMFARCNRSVSYPAPTYYAHLGAFRARAWWDGQRIDVLKLKEEQDRRGQIKDPIVTDTPMFFV